MADVSGEPFWYLTSFRNNFTTSPVAVQDLPHDYSRSQLMNEPVIEGSDFIAYLWAVVIHVITSASITFTAAAAGGPGSTTTPIVNVGLLSSLGHVFIGLLKGQGLETMATPLLIAWPYAAVTFLGTPAKRDDMGGIRIAAAICRRAAFVLMAYGMIAVPFSYHLSAHMVLDFPDCGLMTLFENPAFPHGIITPLFQLAIDTTIMYMYYDSVGIVYYQVKYWQYTFIRAFLFALGGSAYWWWIDHMQQKHAAAATVVQQGSPSPAPASAGQQQASSQQADKES